MRPDTRVPDSALCEGCELRFPMPLLTADLRYGGYYCPQCVEQEYLDQKARGVVDIFNYGAEDGRHA